MTTTTPSDCAWYDLACKGGEEVANAGLSAITRSIAAGAQMLLGQILQTLDEASQVPLSDPAYQRVYIGFLGLATPVIGVVLCVAVVMACLRRDAATLGRAVVGVAVAGLGGAFYIVFAQLLVAIDDWLSHGVVEVTGYDLARAIEQLAVGFSEIAGAPGEQAANMLLILLMLIMLVSGVILWFVLVLRKIAILVVVAFAPLLIAGYLWEPTRAWVRRLTEVLIALVFTKTAIFALFGVGLSLLFRSNGQTLSDFIGATVLMCGACFTPLMMLRLVHFAADTHLARDAMSTLRDGAHPITSRLPGIGSTPTIGRREMANSQGQAPTPGSKEPRHATTLPPGQQGASAPGAAAGTTPATGAGGTGTAGAAGTAGTAAAGAATAGVAAAGTAAAQAARAGGRHLADAGEQLPNTPRGPNDRPAPEPQDSPMPGPDLHSLQETHDNTRGDT